PAGSGAHHRASAWRGDFVSVGAGQRRPAEPAKLRDPGCPSATDLGQRRNQRLRHLPALNPSPYCSNSHSRNSWKPWFREGQSYRREIVFHFAGFQFIRSIRSARQTSASGCLRPQHYSYVTAVSSQPQYSRRTKVSSGGLCFLPDAEPVPIHAFPSPLRGHGIEHILKLGQNLMVVADKEKKNSGWLWPLGMMVTGLGAAGVVLFRGCWHGNMSWPVRSQDYSYQVCLNCGI